MDRNTILGVVIIAGIIILFSILNKPSKEELETRRREQQRIRDSIERVEAKRAQEEIEKESKTENIVPVIGEQDTLKTDSKEDEKLKQIFGTFSDAAKGEQKFVTLENSKMKLTVSTRGGRPYSLMLKEYKRYDSSQVVLFHGEENNFGLNFYANNRRISTNQLFFKPVDGKSSVSAETGSGGDSIQLRLYADNESYIEYTYSIKPDDYMMDFNIRLNGMDDVIAQNTSYLDLKWQIDVPGQEKGREWETDNTTIYYKHFRDETDYLTERSESEEETIATRLKWFAFKQHFFSSVLIADQHFSNGYFKYVENLTSEEYIMNFLAEVSFPYKGRREETIPFSLYFGPNHYNTLSQYDLAMERVVPLGWGIFGWVNRFIVIPLFNWLGSFIHNYGLIILLMTIIIKIGLFPLTYKSYLSSAKMRVLKPQVEEINKKFPKKEDAMKKQQAVMALYKRVGVNPMGGCIPMLLQFPILIAMFRFFPASIELRQKSFLWANDLSTYDSILELPFEIPFYGDHVSLFCLLMAASIIVTTKMNTAQMDTGSNQMPGMKMMMYMMPVMMVFWFNNYSSGLSYYYLVSNIISFLQTISIRRFVDDEAILKKLNAQKKKPAKKSKFQQMLDQQVAKQKAIQKGQTKKKR